MESRPKVGLASVVVRDRKFLLGKRKGSHGAGTYGFPGGHLETGESWEACAARELMEETGMTASGFRFFGVTNDIFNPENHYVTLFMLALDPVGEPKVLEPDKCEGWVWKSWDEMQQIPMSVFLPIENLRKSEFNLTNV